MKATGRRRARGGPSDNRLLAPDRGWQAAAAHLCDYLDGSVCAAKESIGESDSNGGVL
jgi:hypothetical protein